MNESIKSADMSPRETPREENVQSVVQELYNGSFVFRSTCLPFCGPEETKFRPVEAEDQCKTKLSGRFVLTNEETETK